MGPTLSHWRNSTVVGEGQGPIVAIGGGSGPSLVARAIAPELDRFVAVVCTTDRGSSTGMCRKLFRMPAPGDLRTTLSTLAFLSGKEDLALLMEERLRTPIPHELEGMALGNLILAALFTKYRDMAAAAATLQKIVEARGCVLPVTCQNADVEAELEDGTVVVGETEVRRVGKPSIRSLRWHGETPEAGPGVLEAVREAELVIIGPGCLYTSIMPCLMVRGMVEAIRERKGLSIYVCNTTTTPGQTDGFSVSRHVAEILKIVGHDGLDGVLLHDGSFPEDAKKMYSSLGVVPLEIREKELEIIRDMGIRAWVFPLTEEPPSRPRVLHKVDTIRHDPQKLRLALQDVCSHSGMGL